MKAKVYFSEEDLQDMQESFHKEKGLWKTWGYIDKNGNLIQVELHLGEEPEEEKELIKEKLKKKK